jgi:hypothetical protein
MMAKLQPDAEAALTRLVGLTLLMRNVGDNRRHMRVLTEAGATEIGKALAKIGFKIVRNK